MNNLDIVVVSTEAPDPLGNAAGRWYYAFAKGLSDRGHRVRWFAAYTRDAYAARARAYLEHSGPNLRLYPYPTRSWWASKRQTLRRPYANFISESLARDLETALKGGYDILDLEQTWAGWLGIGAPRALLSIHWLAQVDLARGALRSFRLLVSNALMKRTEQRLIARFDTIRVLTPQDRRIVQRLNPRARVATVPLAIDPRLYQFGNVEPQTPTIGLVGSMGWHPTRSAAVRLLTSIWPSVKARLRNARALVVGWDARRALSQFVDQPDVTVVENVPEVGPYFRQLSLMAFPVAIGSGMKVKVLEAMAYGVPVVTTSEGLAGIEAVDGIHVGIADDDEGFVQKVIELLMNEAARRAMRLAARRLVEERYSPAPVVSQMEVLYNEMLDQRSSPH
jgi:glycosyltransferase involved in cell wall biosynthesis